MSVWSAGGDVTRVQGHFCLLPLRIDHLDTTLRANDPLPCNGDLSRKGAIKSLHQLAAVLGVPPLFDDHVSLLLPRSEFSEGGELRRRVQMLARDLSQVAVVRIVDKGPGQMWGFCRQWAWDELQNFLVQQGYTRESRDMPEVLRDLHTAISANNWALGTKGKLALLYLIGKAKSQVPAEVLWRPIAAAAAPVVSRQKLRAAARAFTLFVRTLVAEIPGSFLTLRLKDMGAWLQKLGKWGAEFIGEADCKEQFNVIPPSSVLQHMRDAAIWLTTRRRWRATTLVWSIHKTNKSHDRAGEGKRGTFHVLSMNDLISLVEFSLSQDNVVVAAGELWQRTGAIPMGGSFSAQSADLHSVWCCKLRVDLLRRWGQFSKTSDGVVQWSAGDTLFALQQFRDNLVVASQGPEATDMMKPVCSVLEEVWSLKVVCDRRSKNPDLPCTGACMRKSLTAMGISVHLGSLDVLAHAHPNALGKQWNLKMGIPLQSFWATTRKRVTNTFIGALCNALPSVATWGGFLLSLVAWMQLAVLSQYPVSVVRSAMICAAVRVLACTPWDTAKTVRWISFITGRLPQDMSFSVADLWGWLRRTAEWSLGFYASWHVPHEGPCTEWCGDWAADGDTLCALANSAEGPALVGWGVHRGRGVH